MKKIIAVTIITSFIHVSSFAQEKAIKFTVDGMDVIMKPTSKDIINVSVFYRGGVAAYPKTEAGIGNLALAGASECGTKNYTKDEFKDKEDKYGISIGGSETYDYGSISLDCIKKYLDEGWNLLEAAVMSPVYDAKEFDLLTQKVISGIKSNEADPDEKISEMSVENTFKGTAYATNPAGDTASVSNLNAEAVKNYYYNQLLNKGRIFVVVVGNLSKDEVTSRIRKSFSKIPSGKFTSPSYKTPVLSKNTLNVEPRKLATNYIIGIFNAPKYTSGEFVANRLAMATFSDNLFKEIRTNRNLSYAPYAYNPSYQMPYNLMYVSTTNPQAAAEVMVDEIKRLKTQGFSQKEFTNSRNLFITINYMKEQSAGAIASALGVAEVMGDWKMADEFVEKAQKTTPAEMTAVFKKYVDGISWNYLGDAAKADEAKAAFEMPTK